MRIQGINITYAKLKELLGLPNKTQIVGIERRDRPRSFTIYVEHPTFNELDEECQVEVWCDLDEFLKQLNAL